MFGLSLFQRSKPAKAARPSFRPHVDELETRLCPDGSSLTLAAQVLPGHIVQLSGTVTGGQVSGVTVSFSGTTSGTTQTDQNGAYRFTTTSAALGSVAAEIQPPGSSPVTVKATIMDPTPVLRMAISYGAQNSVTLTGTLTDLDPAGETVTLTGVATGSVATDSKGNFSLTTNASALGAIDATATDLWGVTSNTAEVMVASAAPVITRFSSAHQVGTLYYFSGTVTAPNPAGLVITFGGLDGALNGESTPVRSDGTFAVSFFLPAGTDGIATATTTDVWGQVSNEAWAVVI